MRSDVLISNMLQIAQIIYVAIVGLNQPVGSIHRIIFLSFHTVINCYNESRLQSRTDGSTPIVEPGT